MTSARRPYLLERAVNWLPGAVLYTAALTGGLWRDLRAVCRLARTGRANTR